MIHLQPLTDQFCIQFQLNLASDHFDLSQLYGTTPEVSRGLRVFSGGKLKSNSHHSLTSETRNHHCLLRNASCGESGDSRVNFSPYTIVQHSIFQQSHNKIADGLKRVNPGWTDEELFQTARKINIVIFQKITYKEWLPMVIGYERSSMIQTHADRQEQSPANVMRGVSNEFATAAIRFYNSMLPGDLYDQPQTNRNKKLFELRDTFYQPEAVQWTEAIRTKIVASTLTQKAMALDTSYVDDVSVLLVDDLVILAQTVELKRFLRMT